MFQNHFMSEQSYSLQKFVQIILFYNITPINETDIRSYIKHSTLKCSLMCSLIDNILIFRLKQFYTCSNLFTAKGISKFMYKWLNFQILTYHRRS